jgi:predicted Mrr-cat superfamily restriction endonuclease
MNGDNLFIYDTSHQSYYAGSKLSAVIGQVQKYIEELDAERYTIMSKDGEDTNKIRAKIIVGRDNDNTQQQALRRFNGHLHRIEVLTFDQLSRIAGRVVGYLEGLVPSPDVRHHTDLDEIPF